jgi:hypothetical protein
VVIRVGILSSLLRELVEQGLFDNVEKVKQYWKVTATLSTPAHSKLNSLINCGMPEQIASIRGGQGQHSPEEKEIRFLKIPITRSETERSWKIHYLTNRSLENGLLAWMNWDEIRGNSPTRHR